MKKIVALVLSLVMVLGLATTAFAVDATIYSWSDSAKDWVDMSTLGTAWELSGDLDDQTLGYDDGYLPCYTANGKFFVETTAASALWKMVYGPKTVYLTEVDEEDVAFVAKASVLDVVETADAECGDYHVATLGLKDVYYVSYDAKTGLPNGFYKADKTSSDNVLVDGKLVAVQVLGTGVVSFADHTWVGYDVVDYVYTTVKCSECGNVAKLYANAEAAGKKAQPVAGLGWITAADAFNYGVSAPAVDSDKVESAETFDAGIAMYVGMSVMAAAGSAVVLKKKD